MQKRLNKILTLALSSICIISGAAADGQKNPATSQARLTERALLTAIEAKLTDTLRAGYTDLLRTAKVPHQPGSGEFERSLKATSRAVLAGRPSSCQIEEWLSAKCGNRSFNAGSSAMSPTLQIGELFIAVPFSEQRRPKRGDIVIYRRPGLDGTSATEFIHRIIALPGERIEIRKGLIYLNGVRMRRTATGRIVPIENGTTDKLEEYIERLSGGRRIVIGIPPGNPEAIPDYLDEMPQIIVPSGKYFVLGDNRHNSIDSRAPAPIGAMPSAEDIVGLPQIITLSRSVSRIGTRPR